MFFGPFLSGSGLIALFAALLISVLLYWKNIKDKIVAVGNLTLLLVFIVSLVYAISVLAKGLEGPSEATRMIYIVLLMNGYAGICNVAARVWARVAELMGNKRLKISVHTEIVEK
jgi:vacuolar-type H+-ATPase subunit I/STV1